MFSNYFKISLRSLLKDKSTAVINIGGLAMGMAVTMLLGLWIYEEVTFNQYHSNYRQIGIAMVSETRDGKIGTTRITGVPLGTELKRSYKEDFKYVVPATQLTDYILAKDDIILTTSGNYMGPDAPEMFTLRMIKGTRQGLKEPNSILLSASLARKFFREEDPINQVLSLNRRANVLVTGVYEDIPGNSELYNMEFIAPWDLYIIENKWVHDVQGSWRDNFLKTFVQLNELNSFDLVSSKIKHIKRIHAEPEVASRKPEVFIQPMSRWHLFSKFENGVSIKSDPLKLVWMYGMIGLFVLILACINFINLSTAQSEKRSKEVGVRKTLGSGRIQLVLQFFSESILVCVFAFVVAVGMTMLILPWFNQVANKNLHLPWSNPAFWLSGIVFILISAGMAGFYPAVYLSSFKPINVFKKMIPTGNFSSWPRKTLVTFQFSISIALIIATGIVYKQIQYSKDRPIGYEQNSLVELKFASSNNKSKTDILESEFLKAGVIQSMATSGGELTQVWSNNGGFEWKGKDPKQIAYFGTLAVSPTFGKTIGWQVTEGRDFSGNMATDSNSLILNEAAVKLMGLDHPVGEFIQRETYDGKTVHHYQVIGVTKDLLMASPYEPAKPSVFFINGYKNRTLLKLNPAISVHEALSKVEAIHKRVLPDAPFDYRFVDDAFNEKFSQEIRVGTLALFFAVLTVFISCLGLFGVAAFHVEKRAKEIGIRKVLGASVSVILKLLSKEFIPQVILAICLASPLTYYMMNKWLQNYEYRTVLPWWIFAGAGSLALVISVLTVSVRTLKTALANPIQSLRNE